MEFSVLTQAGHQAACLKAGVGSEALRAGKTTRLPWYSRCSSYMLFP